MKPDLSQLRDIHLPEPVSWWPPAIGWWMLLGIVLLAATGVWWMHRRRQRNAWRRSSLAELARLRQQYQANPSSPQPVVSELSVLLRRVAISRFPREESAKLSGEQWLVFLDRSNTDGSRFQSGEGRLLVVAPYAQQINIASEQMDHLFALCENWITKLSAKSFSGVRQ